MSINVRGMSELSSGHTSWLSNDHNVCLPDGQRNRGLYRRRIKKATLFTDRTQMIAQRGLSALVVSFCVAWSFRNWLPGCGSCCGAKRKRRSKFIKMNRKRRFLLIKAGDRWIGRLSLWQNCVFHAFSDTEFQSSLRRDLNCFSGRRVSTFARLSLGLNELPKTGKDKLTVGLNFSCGEI